MECMYSQSSLNILIHESVSRDDGVQIHLENYKFCAGIMNDSSRGIPGQVPGLVLSQVVPNLMEILVSPGTMPAPSSRSREQKDAHHLRSGLICLAVSNHGR